MTKPKCKACHNKTYYAPYNAKPPLLSCKVNSRDIQTQPLLTFATRIYLPKGTAQEQGHGRRSYEVFSLNPLYQPQEDYWNINNVSTNPEEWTTLQSFP